MLVGDLLRMLNACESSDAKDRSLMTFKVWPGGSIFPIRADLLFILCSERS